MHLAQGRNRQDLRLPARAARQRTVSRGHLLSWHARPIAEKRLKEIATGARNRGNSEATLSASASQPPRRIRPPLLIRTFRGQRVLRGLGWLHVEAAAHGRPHRFHRRIEPHRRSIHDAVTKQRFLSGGDLAFRCVELQDLERLAILRPVDRAPRARASAASRRCAAARTPSRYTAC